MFGHAPRGRHRGDVYYMSQSGHSGIFRVRKQEPVNLLYSVPVVSILHGKGLSSSELELSTAISLVIHIYSPWKFNFRTARIRLESSLGPHCTLDVAPDMSMTHDNPGYLWWPDLSLFSNSCKIISRTVSMGQYSLSALYQLSLNLLSQLRARQSLKYCVLFLASKVQ